MAALLIQLLECTVDAGSCTASSSIAHLDADAACVAGGGGRGAPENHGCGGGVDDWSGSSVDAWSGCVARGGGAGGDSRVCLQIGGCGGGGGGDLYGGFGGHCCWHFGGGGTRDEEA